MSEPEKPSFEFISEEVLSSIEKASRRQGEALAMLFNLPEGHSKKDIWSTEAVVWGRRSSELLDNVPIQRKQLADYAANIMAAGCINNVLTKWYSENYSIEA